MSLAADEGDGWRELAAAAARPEVDAALRSLYAELDRVVAARGARCDQSGRCCRFDSYGHRLYVTALEVAWFVRQAGPPAAAASGGLTVLTGRDGCAYQAGGLCTVHAVRPMGCRVFFCEPGTEAWQQETYERFLGELRRLHERAGVAYRYVEWRGAVDGALAAQSG